MRPVDWLTVLVAALGTVLLPVLVIVSRNSRKSGTIESKLDDLAAEQRRMWESIDRRVRWIEERLWGPGRGPRQR